MEVTTLDTRSLFKYTKRASQPANFIIRDVMKFNEKKTRGD